MLQSLVCFALVQFNSNVKFLVNLLSGVRINGRNVVGNIYGSGTMNLSKDS